MTDRTEHEATDVMPDLGSEVFGDAPAEAAPAPAAKPPRRRVRRGGTPAVGRGARVIAVAAVLALVAAAVVLWPRSDTIKVTGSFSRAVGLYPGSDVRILGVHVGKVLSVKPEGDHVAVAFEFDAKYKVPADAKAAVVAPSLVSDRYVQLLPAYTSGPLMKDGAHIGLDRTAVPVELDRISTSLDDLLVALGPKGANKDGALSNLLDTGARNLKGEGTNIHDTNHDLSLALSTLSGGRNDLFSTVKNLQSFTSMLATNDTQVRRLNTDLANVSDQLAGERGDLAAALKNLAVALSETSSFVHDNRAVLKTDIGQLTSVTSTIARQRSALAETLDNAPVAISNLQNAYNPKSGTLDTRNNAAQLKDPALLLCSLITGPTGTGNTQLCSTIQKLLKVPSLPGAAGLPLNLLSPVPSDPALSPAPAGGGGPEGESAADVRGADPTLGGLLGGTR
ncbi:MAG TPA: MCE family protein [Oryzihumus sp.]|nr:MCE family protein [Oryzihumus sp.]